MASSGYPTGDLLLYLGSAPAPAASAAFAAPVYPDSWMLCLIPPTISIKLRRLLRCIGDVFMLATSPPPPLYWPLSWDDLRRSRGYKTCVLGFFSLERVSLSILAIELISSRWNLDSLSDIWEAPPPPCAAAPPSCCEIFNLFLFLRTRDNFAKLIVFLLSLRLICDPSIELPN